MKNKTGGYLGGEDGKAVHKEKPKNSAAML
jgi:hypothetical protein